MKAQFVFDIQAIVEMEEIPPDLIINWDHTGIHYVPVSVMSCVFREYSSIFFTEQKATQDSLVLANNNSSKISNYIVHVCV